MVASLLHVVLTRMSPTADDRSFLAESFNMLRHTTSNPQSSAMLVMVSWCHAVLTWFAAFLAPQNTVAHTALLRKGYDCSSYRWQTASRRGSHLSPPFRPVSLECSKNVKMWDTTPNIPFSLTVYSAVLYQSPIL